MPPTDPASTGRLSRRELPWTERGNLDALSQSQREAAARTWIGRAGGELHTAGTFVYLGAALERLDAPARLREITSAAVDEEQRHAEICRRMASLYAGCELPMPALHPVPVPAYPGASQSLRDSLHVIGHCCVNETTAGAFLERCLDGTTEPLARAVLLVLLGDEIEHARLGWAHLTMLCESPQARGDVGCWLARMLRLNLAGWRADFAMLPGDTLWPHGCPPAHEIDAAVLDGMRTLIIPGFERAGIDVREAREWCETLTPRPVREGEGAMQ